MVPQVLALLAPLVPLPSQLARPISLTAYVWPTGMVALVYVSSVLLLQLPLLARLISATVYVRLGFTWTIHLPVCPVIITSIVPVVLWRSPV